MHPALSVIVFSTASGAGYGLLALLGILAPLDVVPEDRTFGFIALALALAAITGGLLASLFHLGHRERAWRALSQWRSSWLSREGVAAIATYVPAGAFGILWIFLGKVSGDPRGVARPRCGRGLWDSSVSSWEWARRPGVGSPRFAPS